jgi:hypothetical protein
VRGHLARRGHAALRHAAAGEGLGLGSGSGLGLGLGLGLANPNPNPNQAFDVAVLVSGDRDFIPALLRTRERGKRVAVCSMRNEP